MATIECRATESGKNKFRVRVRLKGARVATATFRRRTDAVKWGQATESAIREGRYFKTSASKRYTQAIRSTVTSAKSFRGSHAPPDFKNVSLRGGANGWAIFFSPTSRLAR